MIFIGSFFKSFKRNVLTAKFLKTIHRFTLWRILLNFIYHLSITINIKIVNSWAKYWLKGKICTFRLS